MSETFDTRQFLEPARALLRELESGDHAAAERRLEDLTRLRESSLFQEVGRLTRTLHDTLTSFQLDGRITDFVHKDIPDAHERLNYVVQMTEQAAHRTMQLVENTVPVSDALQQRAAGLKAEWDRFTQRQMDVNDFRTLSKSIGEFLTLAQDHSARIHHGLIEVLTAQEYQDITGQIIHRVIKLVREIEDHLVGLIRVSGQRGPAAAEKRTGIEAEGPQVTSRNRLEVVSSQDEVDALLSSLGF